MLQASDERSQIVGLACSARSYDGDDTLVDLPDIVWQFKVAVGTDRGIAGLLAHIADRFLGRSKRQRTWIGSQHAPHDNCPVASHLGIDRIWFASFAGRHHTAKEKVARRNATKTKETQDILCSHNSFTSTSSALCWDDAQ